VGFSVVTMLSEPPQVTEGIEPGPRVVAA
jgi:hypothetical protein